MDTDKLMPKVKVFEAPGQGWIVVQIAEYYLPRKVHYYFFLILLSLEKAHNDASSFRNVIGKLVSNKLRLSTISKYAGRNKASWATLVQNLVFSCVLPYVVKFGEPR